MKNSKAKNGSTNIQKNKHKKGRVLLPFLVSLAALQTQRTLPKTVRIKQISP